MADGSDDDISADDIAFFQEHAQATRFLKSDLGADPRTKDKAQKKKEQQREEAARKKERAALDRLQGRTGGHQDDADDEGPRRNKYWQGEEEKERKQGLPVKMSDGSIKKVMRENALPDPDTVEEQPAMSKRAQKRARGERIAEKKALERGEVYITPETKQADSEPAQESEEPSSPRGKKRKEKKAAADQAQEVKLLSHEEKKMAIADSCSNLMRDPEKNISALTRLHQFCLDADTIIVKMALLSEAMVFADILPDYRIRLPTEKEKEMKVSKEVAQQRAYEAGAKWSEIQ